MAEKPSGTLFMRSDLSKLSNVPDSFLGKIMQSLAKAEILTSERGKKGGFRLGKAPEEINMYDVILAVDGDLQITDCLYSSEFCDQTRHCSVHKVWNNIQNTITTQLKSTTLKDLM
jgi:Rrf2 family protein